MPKTKISREMVVDAAFEVARAMGIENVNARTVSEKLGCSTQPVMYCFARIEELKRAVYEKADGFHTEYLMNIDPTNGVMLSIGLNYIRFAVKEPRLFRLLFQSGFGTENSLLDMINSEELVPVLNAMRGAMGITVEQTKNVFTTIAMFAHGYASIIANNSLEYDEKTVAADLERAYLGAVLAAEMEEN
ncbi:MAG: TetR/AcrR family transcriptional regulator [Prevotella sp.]|nr:TetR/AcrR family transcriptional regulator [Prevotella sp.]